MADEGLGFLVGILIGVILGSILALSTGNIVSYSNVIEQGHGEYNRTTGKFQFLPACNKEK